MVRFLGTPDATQEELLPFLAGTQSLLSQACEGYGGGEAEVVALPDLGMPHNAARIHGGFLTGALYSWDCPQPFVPVDATVNLCGVAVFEIENVSPFVHSFREAVSGAQVRWSEDTPYVWNFTTGNHFVILARTNEKWYALLHASPAEFKANYPGLYPSTTGWYADVVKTFQGEGGRYLRYLVGRPASRFYERATWLALYQRDRMRSAAELLVGGRHIKDELFNASHYEMKIDCSIGIGCYQFHSGAAGVYPLLTRPEAPIPLVKPLEPSPATVRVRGDTYLVAPHGLGVRSTRPVGLGVEGPRLKAWGRGHERGVSLGSEPEMAIRDYDGRRTVNSVLSQCVGTVVQELEQVASVYRGSEQW